MASHAMTITELEKRINSWSLDNSRDVSMHRGITTINDLLQRSIELRNRDDPIQYPDLFGIAITRIQREDIPKMV